MHQDQFLEQLSAQLELSILKFNSDSVCRLIFDGEFVVDLEWVSESHSLHMYSVVNSRASHIEPRYLEMLKANLFGRGTNGSVFSIDTNRDEVLLIQTFATLHLDITTFVRQLELFVDTASYWKQLLSSSEIENVEAAELNHAADGLIRV